MKSSSKSIHDDVSHVMSSTAAVMTIQTSSELTTSANGLGHAAASRSVVAFESCVLFIGVVGAISNGTLCIILAQMEFKKSGSTNTLILNQTTLDFLSCFFIVVIYSVKIQDIYLTGWSGYLLCQFILNELFLWVVLDGSVTGVVFITLERYFKLVHPILHKKYYRKLMNYVGITISLVTDVFSNVHDDNNSEWAMSGV